MSEYANQIGKEQAKLLYEYLELLTDTIFEVSVKSLRVSLKVEEENWKQFDKQHSLGKCLEKNELFDQDYIQFGSDFRLQLGEQYKQIEGLVSLKVEVEQEDSKNKQEIKEKLSFWENVK